MNRPRGRRLVALSAAGILLAALLFWRPLSKDTVSPPGPASESKVKDTRPSPGTLEKQKLLIPPAAPLTPRQARKKALSPAEIDGLRAAAKVSLSANYGAQKSYFSEYNRYSTDLYAIGWQPEGFPLSFKAGYLQPFYPARLEPNEDPRRMDTDAIAADSYHGEPGFIAYAASADPIVLSSLSRYCQTGCTASERGFEMLVAMNLDEDADLEVWRINEKKQLEQVANDLAN